jgi:NTP pyrophosphatase (non-canonical NTP hydrolase)
MSLFYKDKRKDETYEEYFKRKIQFDEPAGPCVMHEALKKQFELQQRLGTFKKMNCDSDVQQFLNQNTLALVEEVLEVMRETAYKNPAHMLFGWKQGQKFDLEQAKEETVDLLHFYLNLLIIFGMDVDEMMNRYLNKNKENHNRQDNSY